jgi:glucose-1-phosphate thymidylyltransferase
MTRVTNKHLLPVYDRPMVMYPLNTLKEAGIRDILLISGKGHAGHFLELLGSGKEHGVNMSYAVQEKAGGIAEALALAEDFADRKGIAVILGDNIFEHSFGSHFTGGAHLFLKAVADAHRFGVASVAPYEGKLHVTKVVEKPLEPETNYAVTGLYLFDETVFSRIKELNPSARGELEITDVNNSYIRDGLLTAELVRGYWQDAGTPESLYKASTLVRG